MISQNKKCKAVNKHMEKRATSSTIKDMQIETGGEAFFAHHVSKCLSE